MFININVQTILRNKEKKVKNKGYTMESRMLHTRVDA